jgi:DNA adenine methylase
VIKWSGSKRSVAAQLASLFPEYERYYEPFVGGGAMLPFRKVRQGCANDIMPELIQFWTVIRDDPQSAIDGYTVRWQARQQSGHRIYYEIRDHFNETRDPIDFLFLSRTCVNGLIRFNKEGNFNNSLHHTRPGVAPETLGEVIIMWSKAIQGVSFTSSDYANALSDVTDGDFVFLDPPYESTRGRYLHDAFNADRFYGQLDRLNRIGAKWMLTYDGQAGKRHYEVGLPCELFKARVDICTGNSPFTRLMNQNLDNVTESVYMNYEPASGLGCGSLQSALDFREIPVCLEV